MKTLGQVAYEAWHGYAPGPEDWPDGDKMVAKWEKVGAAVAQNHTPLELFDGFDVYQALSDEMKKRTSPENVTDVLDTVVRLMRSNAK